MLIITFAPLLALFLYTLYTSVVASFEGDESAAPFVLMSGFGTYIMCYVLISITT